MLAYVFWHRRRSEADQAGYEHALAGFHAALAADPPAGFAGSAAYRLQCAPWLAGEGVYEDRYLIADFASLGALNEAAVSGSRQEPHSRVARQAAGGAGGLYRLIQGEPSLAAVNRAAWFPKPEGIGYEELEGLLATATTGGSASLWLRQMVLGPAPELCLLTAGEPSLPPPVAADILRLDTV